MGGRKAASAAGFIFDCDGTLMDTIDAWHKAEDALMAQAGISLTKAQRDQLNSLSLEEAGVFFYENFEGLESPDQVTDLIIDYLLDFYRTQAEAKPGVHGFLEALSAANAPMAVLSSSPQSFLQAGLGRAGLLGYFDAVVSVDDLATTKRHEITYLQLCESLGTDPHRTWFFDDSWYALSAAQAAGLRTFGIHSSDNCGTHQELLRFASHVEEDFSNLDPERFLQP